ncbi:MAG: aspartate carbamoyltransferase catalytic subunit [Amphiplicatus sp.]
MQNAPRPAPPAAGWKAKNLVSVDDLTTDEIRFVLDLAEHYAGFLKQGARPPQRLAGKTQINLFYEDSTRTNLSFALAGQKLGADVINVPVAASSVNKGETELDTAQTLTAMGAHALILRHKQPRIHEQLAHAIPCPILNAGDGVREHPTQALLDAAAIRSVYGEVKGLIIAICGDIRHSRVAGSDAHLFVKLGAEVRFVGPAHLMPDATGFPHIKRYDSLKAGLFGADIVMGLRMQVERMGEAGKDAARGYYETFGLTHETLKLAKQGAWVMHPGPMNRGVEIDGVLADDPERSLVLRQVFYGVAVRMACLDALITGGA